MWLAGDGDDARSGLSGSGDLVRERHALSSDGGAAEVIARLQADELRVADQHLAGCLCRAASHVRSVFPPRPGSRVTAVSTAPDARRSPCICGRLGAQLRGVPPSGVYRAAPDDRLPERNCTSLEVHRSSRGEERDLGTASPGRHDGDRRGPTDLQPLGMFRCQVKVRCRGGSSHHPRGRGWRSAGGSAPTPEMTICLGRRIRTDGGGCKMQSLDFTAR